ncbi:MAG: 6-bladed beta-propeller, partial [Tannerella sp.]|nr:6-bladed beta-propeller [Tannerella sp.]
MNKSYVLLSLLFLLSCHQTEKSYEGIELVKIDVDRKACMDMSEFIEKIEIVPFQTDTNCLVGEYNKFIYCKELSMYIYKDRRGIVSLFSDDGKFISNSESVIGPGPGEYQIVVDVAYNPFSQAIELLGPYGTIYRYDLSFNFIEKISLNQNKIVFDLFHPLSAEQYVLIPLGKSIMYYCDFSKKEILLPPLNYNDDGIHMMTMNYNSFFYIEDELFFSPQGATFHYI